MQQDTIEFEGQRLHRWRVGASTFLAIPERGARLVNWNLTFADGSFREVIRWPENADWDAIGSVRGGNPILFPFAARTFDQGEIGWWRTADGKRRAMPMHGYARNGTFALEEIADNGFVACFQPDAACQQSYPFDYRFSVRYRFHELSLQVELTLENQDTVAIPWSAGHHFYFSLPWHEGLTDRDYAVDISARKAFRHTGDGRLEPVKSFDSRTFFNDPELVDRIHTRLKSNTVCFGPAGEEEFVTLHIGDDPVPPAWTSVVTWRERPQDPYYCVEPWMGPPNAAGHGKGLYRVEPGQTQSFRVEVSLL